MYINCIYSLHSSYPRRSGMSRETVCISIGILSIEFFSNKRILCFLLMISFKIFFRSN